MAYYKAIVEAQRAIKSEKKKTPGLEFEVTIRERKNGDNWEPCDWVKRSVFVWFPSGGDVSFTLKKLKFAGWGGGSLESLKLEGSTVILESHWETFEEKEREKFELALPPRSASKPDGDAFLAIDAILSAVSIDEVPDVPAFDQLDRKAAPPDPEMTKLRDASQSKRSEAAAQVAAAESPENPPDQIPF
jgi:hypothetical protein